MKIVATTRLFTLTSLATGTSYPLTSEEAQRLLDEYPAHSATKYKVVLHGHNTPDPNQRTVLQPASRDGGPAFLITK